MELGTGPNADSCVLNLVAASAAVPESGFTALSMPERCAIVSDFWAFASDGLEEVLRLLVADREFREDLPNNLPIEARPAEPGQPLNDVLAYLEK